MLTKTRFAQCLTLSSFAALGSLALVVGCGGSSDGATGSGLLPPAFVAANGVNGGKAFDKFWAIETGWSQADPNLAKYNAKTSFYRCKACHAGDLLGRNGVYINRDANASRPHIADVTLRTVVDTSSAQELFDDIKRSAGRRDPNFDLTTYNATTNFTEGDKMPDYSKILTDAQIWEIVKFLKAEAIDTRKLYDSVTTGAYPTGTIAYSNIGKGGNAAAGDTIYKNQCSWCHGTDGKLIPLGTYGVGGFVRNRPDEAQHKIKFGQLGSGMGSIIIDPTKMLDLYKAMTNATKYPN